MVLKHLWIAYEQYIVSITMEADIELSDEENAYLEVQMNSLPEVNAVEYWAVQYVPDSQQVFLALATEEQKSLTKIQRLRKIMTYDMPMIEVDDQIRDILFDFSRLIPSSMRVPNQIDQYITFDKIQAPDLFEIIDHLFPDLGLSLIKAKKAFVESCCSKLGIVPFQEIKIRILLYYCNTFYGYLSIYNDSDLQRQIGGSMRNILSQNYKN